MRLGNDRLSAKELTGSLAIAQHQQYAILRLLARRIHTRRRGCLAPMLRLEPGHLIARDARTIKQIGYPERLLESGNRFMPVHGRSTVRSNCACASGTPARAFLAAPGALHETLKMGSVARTG
jgi:hypothetical protein